MVSPVDNDVNAPLPLGFTEYKTSGQEHYDFKEGKADFVRIFDGPWENRQAFIFEHVLPRVTEANGSTIYSSPSLYPDYVYARAYKADVEGLLRTDKTEQNFIKHTIARVTVSYSTPDFVDEPGGGNRPPGSNDRIYVVETVDTETEIFPIPARKFIGYYYENGDYAGQYPGSPGSTSKKFTEDGKIPYVINRFIYKLKLPYVIFPRWADIDNCLGRVNFVPFVTPSGLYAPPTTLRYDGLSSVTKRELSIGALVWEMEHKFTYYKYGWNTRPQVLEEGSRKIVHALLDPPLFYTEVLQKIFVPVDSSAVQRAIDHFLAQPQSTINRFHVPDRGAGFSQEEIRQNFINNPDTLNIFI